MDFWEHTSSIFENYFSGDHFVQGAAQLVHVWLGAVDVGQIRLRGPVVNVSFLRVIQQKVADFYRPIF